jgi:sRNA-binding carbon storage regulator CsrA
MALALTVKTDDNVLIGDDLLNVVRVFDGKNARIRLGETTMSLYTHEARDVGKDVYLSVRPYKAAGEMKLVIEAPKEILIERLEKVRDFLVAPSAMDDAVLWGDVASRQECTERLRDSTPYSGRDYPARRHGDLVFVMNGKVVISVFDQKRAEEHWVDVICTTCDDDGTDCITCSSKGRMRVTRLRALEEGLEMVMEDRKNDNQDVSD